ncbi:hypothetical protein BDN71DRAFT_1509565 [Pleurotus eryngii]|uniref:Uncharacterized protein n=1 Tax=Pleurotus eryngii TaxID=5323 RepID=A0A9P5ZRG7_PLEER|nr:hypothetical protein BDN71DRAFT_1509565 [Pleurotus eryngii]
MDRVATKRRFAILEMGRQKREAIDREEPTVEPTQHVERPSGYFFGLDMSENGALYRQFRRISSGLTPPSPCHSPVHPTPESPDKADGCNPAPAVERNRYLAMSWSKNFSSLMGNSIATKDHSPLITYRDSNPLPYFNVLPDSWSGLNAQ